MLPALCVALGSWGLVAHLSYLAAYRTLHLEDLRTSSGQGEQQLGQADWWMNASGWTPLVARLFRTEQPESELEQLRRRAIGRWRLCMMLIPAAMVLWLLSASQL
jgi:hypothetical protein